MAKRIVPDPLEQPTISVPEAGAMLGLKSRTSYDAVKRGEIPTIPVGRGYRVPTAVFLRQLGFTVD
jgi:excisionase family DNA binding protein